jgi:hypothetical protein
MKKSILILCTVLTVFSLTAFGYNSWNNNGSDQEKPSRSKTVIINDDLLNFLPKQATLL